MWGCAPKRQKTRSTSTVKCSTERRSSWKWFLRSSTYSLHTMRICRRMLERKRKDSWMQLRGRRQCTWQLCVRWGLKKNSQTQAEGIELTRGHSRDVEKRCLACCEDGQISDCCDRSNVSFEGRQDGDFHSATDSRITRAGGSKSLNLTWNSVFFFVQHGIWPWISFVSKMCGTVDQKKANLSLYSQTDCLVLRHRTATAEPPKSCVVLNSGKYWR